MATKLDVDEATTEKKIIRQNSSKNADTNNKKDGQDSVVDEDINMEVKEEPAKDATNSIKPNPVFGIMGSENIARRIVQLLADGNIAAKIFDKDTDKPIKVAEIKDFAESVDIILSCYDIPDQINMDLCRGVIKLLSAGKGFVQTSVVEYKYSVDFNELCDQNGIKYLESIIVRTYDDINTIKAILSNGNNELYNECAKCFHLLTAKNLYKGEIVGNVCAVVTAILAQSISTMVAYLGILTLFLMRRPSDLCVAVTLQRLAQSFGSKDLYDFIMEKLRDPEGKFGMTLGEMAYHAGLYQKMNDTEIGPQTYSHMVILTDIVNKYDLKDVDVAYLYRNAHIIFGFPTF